MSIRNIFSNMSEGSAKKVSDSLILAAEELSKTLKTVRLECQDTDYLFYGNKVANVISDIGNIMEEIYVIHPELRPYKIERL